MTRIHYSLMRDTVLEVLRKAGLAPERAAECAETLTENTFDGVLSHGILFVEALVQAVERGDVDPTASPERLARLGAVERWDGRNGLGIWNARRATERAMQLAGEHGIGCVALQRTNHWSRAGAYGWQAVREGFALICWTNTIPLIPAWGAVEVSVGNNPLVVAVPHPERPVVLDMAMSQFAMGKLKIHERSGAPLPVPGGYDAAGQLTRDAGEILRSGRVLPIGFWKGSGLALVLDILAVLLSGGLGSADQRAQGMEKGVSQVFIAFRLPLDPVRDADRDPIAQALDSYCAAAAESPGAEVLYPGQRALRDRQRNRAEGMLIDAAVWERLLERLGGG